MFRARFSAVLVAAVVSAAVAQERARTRDREAGDAPQRGAVQRGERRAPVDKQGGKRAERGPRQEGRRAGPPQPLEIGPLAQRLAKVLELSDAQREEYKAIVKKYVGQAQERRGRDGAAGELLRELRAARAAGDEARVQEIRQLLRGARSGARGQVGEFLDEVESILTEAQTDKLAQIRARLRERPGTRRAGGAAGRRAGDAEGVPPGIRALRRELKLDPEQQRVFDEAVGALRERVRTNRPDPQEVRPLVQELRKARQAGDDARVAEIRAQLRKQRPEAGTAIDAFLADIEPVLNEEQKAVIEKMRRDGGAEGRRDTGARLRDRGTEGRRDTGAKSRKDRERP